LHDKPSTRRNDRDSTDVECVDGGATREIEALDNPPQDEQETKDQDGSAEFTDFRGCCRFDNLCHLANSFKLLPRGPAFHKRTR